MKLQGQSMVGPLRRVIVCSPERAGWRDPGILNRWRELQYLHRPCPDIASEQHAKLCNVLTEAGGEVVNLEAPANGSLDSIFVHDPCLPTDRGMILLRMGKACRQGEVESHRATFSGMSIPVLAELTEPATAEGGDLVWLNHNTLLVGLGYRTNRAALDQFQEILAPYKVEVIPAILPYFHGPKYCLHLMSLMSMLDEEHVLVDLPWLSVETVQLLESYHLKFIEIEASERDTLACNVLALGNKKLLAFEENRRTCDKLSAAGFEVIAVPGSELGINGGGGPTCLTRPLDRW